MPTTKKCLRTGCPNPRAEPDIRQLGLCPKHYTAMSAGTIGDTANLHRRQHPTHQAQKLLNDLTQPGDSLRQLAKRTGLTKDTIHHIQRGTWKHLRSKSWEQLQEAWARHQYQQQLQQHNQLAA